MNISACKNTAGNVYFILLYFITFAMHTCYEIKIYFISLFLTGPDWQNKSWNKSWKKYLFYVYFILW